MKIDISNDTTNRSGISVSAKESNVTIFWSFSRFKSYDDYLGKHTGNKDFLQIINLK